MHTHKGAERGSCRWGSLHNTWLNSSQAHHRRAISPLKPISTSPEEHNGRWEAQLQTHKKDTLRTASEEPQPQHPCQGCPRRASAPASRHSTHPDELKPKHLSDLYTRWLCHRSEGHHEGVSVPSRQLSLFIQHRGSLDNHLLNS